MQQNSNGFEWNETTIARLRTLWDDGFSTAEIGRHLGTTKNAVVGKAHRLDLPERPSPIRRDGPPKPPRPRLPPPPKLPPLPSLTMNPPAIAAEPAAAPAPPRVQRRVPTALIRPLGTRVTPCCWPVGNPGAAGFHFCAADSVPGRPYCEDHCRLGYVRMRKRNAA
jgi:GcrA cell cycle regulator